MLDKGNINVFGDDQRVIGLRDELFAYSKAVIRIEDGYELCVRGVKGCEV